jgi:hypothetical protein
MVEVIYEERIGGRTVAWTQGLTVDVRDSVRLWLERYPGLFRGRLVRAGWDTCGLEPPPMAILDGVDGRPEEEVLMIVQSTWYQHTPEERERQFVFDLLVCSMARAGRLSHDFSGGTRLHIPGFMTLHDEEAVTFLAELADTVVAGRGTG